MSDPSPTHPAIPDCSVSVSWAAETAVLAVTGTVDMLTASTLEAAIADAIAPHPTAVIVDLTEVDFLASHGMRVLIQAHNSMAPEMAFLVVADGPITARPMKLIGLTEIITVYPTLGEALLGLAA
jgi:anti-sigma B factor antagonist